MQALMLLVRIIRHPCFGAASGLTSRQWWAIVIEQTYRNTEFLSGVEPDEWAQLLPDLTELLYETIFNTKEGWVVKEVLSLLPYYLMKCPYLSSIHLSLRRCHLGRMWSTR